MPASEVHELPFELERGPRIQSNYRAPRPARSQKEIWRSWRSPSAEIPSGLCRTYPTSCGNILSEPLQMAQPVLLQPDVIVEDGGLFSRSVFGCLIESHG